MAQLNSSTTSLPDWFADRCTLSPSPEQLQSNSPRKRQKVASPSRTSPRGVAAATAAMAFEAPDALPTCAEAGDALSLPITHDADSETEEDADGEADLGSVERHKSVIMHLIGQLKLDMDLTKVVLPTFILEKRSLLEMFADCMSHPTLFLRINHHIDPCSRMIAVVEWYLTSFYAGRKGCVAKKPYNPIIGESFHCSWNVSASDLDPRQNSNGDQHCPPSSESDRKIPLFFCGEQVSHHPPVSAFYFECPEEQMFMNASIHTKSKFLGTSIGVIMLGKLRLRLLGHDETYTLDLPSAYARSILAVPWMELGDRVAIQCDATGYQANLTFHTKSFYSARVHRVTGDVRHPNGHVVCKVQGEWNGVLEFERLQAAAPSSSSAIASFGIVGSSAATANRYAIDVRQLTAARKRVRPLEAQRPHESRRLWLPVSAALRRGDMSDATRHKNSLEEKQRYSEKRRKHKGEKFVLKFFEEDVSNNRWEFKKQLQMGQITSNA